MKEQLYKMINGIEPSIILAFSVFCDNAVPMYGNYRKKQNSHPFLKVCLKSYGDMHFLHIKILIWEV